MIRPARRPRKQYIHGQGTATRLDDELSSPGVKMATGEHSPPHSKWSPEQRTSVRRYSAGPDGTTRPRGSFEKKVTAEHIEFVCLQIGNDNKITLNVLCERLFTSLGMAESASTIVGLHKVPSPH